MPEPINQNSLARDTTDFTRTTTSTMQHQQQQQQITSTSFQTQQQSFVSSEQLHRQDLSMQIKSGGMLLEGHSQGQQVEDYVGSLRPTTTGEMIRQPGDDSQAVYSLASSQNAYRDEEVYSQAQLKSVSKDPRQTGVFVGIIGDNNSLVESEDYKSHTVRNLVEHFSKTKPGDIPPHFLPQQQMVNSGQAPPLSYLKEQAKSKEFSFKEKQSYSASQSTTSTGKTGPLSAEENAERLKLFQRRGSLKEYLTMDTESSLQTQSSSVSTANIVDPSAILQGCKPFVSPDRPPSRISLRATTSSPIPHFRSHMVSPKPFGTHHQQPVNQHSRPKIQRPPLPMPTSKQQHQEQPVPEPAPAPGPEPVPIQPAQVQLQTQDMSQQCIDINNICTEQTSTQTMQQTSHRQEVQQYTHTNGVNGVTLSEPEEQQQRIQEELELQKRKEQEVKLLEEQQQRLEQEQLRQNQEQQKIRENQARLEEAERIANQKELEEIEKQKSPEHYFTCEVKVSSSPYPSAAFQAPATPVPAVVVPQAIQEEQQKAKSPEHYYTCDVKVSSSPYPSPLTIPPGTPFQNQSSSPGRPFSMIEATQQQQQASSTFQSSTQRHSFHQYSSTSSSASSNVVVGGQALAQPKVDDPNSPVSELTLIFALTEPTQLNIDGRFQYLFSNLFQSVFIGQQG